MSENAQALGRKALHLALEALLKAKPGGTTTSITFPPVPTPPPPTAGNTLFSTTTGSLAVEDPQGIITDLSPHVQGTLDQQLADEFKFLSVGTTTTNGQSVSLDIPIPLGHAAKISFAMIGRCVTAGVSAVINDTFYYEAKELVINDGGAPAVVPVVTNSPYSYANGTFGGVGSDTTGPDIFSKVATQSGDATAVIDWVLEGTVRYN